MNSHTPTFWNNIGAIEGLIGARETAEIIKAVNNHDALVEALKQAKSFIQGITGECPNIIKKTLKAVESEG